MTLDTLIMLLGAFVLIEPQLGFPHTWDTPLLSIAGIIVIALGIAERRRGLKDRPAKLPESAPETENAHA